jgi:hypothetical protein
MRDRDRNKIMAGLPKIALARLKANAETAKTAAHSLGSAGFQGAEHPDANLLAAFAEKSLAEQERTQVLNHLSQCAECREVAALTAPAETGVPQPNVTVARRRWNSRYALRWGSLAAVLGTVTVVVLLHPGGWKRPMQISKATIPPARAGNVSGTPQVVPAPLSLRPTVPIQGKAQDFSRKEREQAVVGKAPESGRDKSASRQDAVLQEPAAGASVRQQMGMVARSRAGGSEAEGGGSVKTEQARRGINMPGAKDSATSRFPAAPAAQPMADSDEAGKANAQSGAAPEKMHSMTQSVEVTAEAPAPATENARLKSSAGLGGFSAASKKMDVNNIQPSALWSVSANGKVRRSTDGGKSFKHIHVGHGVRFRAIASLGKDVWAGGTGGTLFHSVDGGATWTETTVNSGENAVTETIVGIQMRVVEHLTVTTDSGSKWFSEDGGHSWRKQP